MRAIRLDREPEQPGGAGDDALQLLVAVEVEPDGDAEAVTQGRGQQTLAGGRADQGEGRQVDANRARRRPLTDDEVQRAVFHRGIEHFLDHGGEAVDLVDEQHVVRFEIGEQRGEIARLGDDGAGGGAEADPKLARDDLRQRGFAEAGRAEEQRMIHRLPARARGGDEDGEVPLGRLLPDEFGQAARAQGRVRVAGLAGGGVEGVGIVQNGFTVNPSRCNSACAVIAESDISTPGIRSSGLIP